MNDGHGRHHGPRGHHGPHQPVHDRRRVGPNGERRHEAPPEPEEEGLAEFVPGADAEPKTGAAAGPVVPAEALRAMEERALAAEAKLREVAESFRAAQRDLENTRARLERDQEQRVRETLARAFGGVLGAIDHLELAMEHAEDGPLKAGVALTVRQLQDALAAEGLERLETLGRPFDPSISEAVAVVPTADPEQNDVVVEVYRPAYSLRGQVIRPAQVRVAKLS